MTPDEKERHLRMCKALSELIASEGYMFALARLKEQKQAAWAKTAPDQMAERDNLYLETHGLIMVEQDLLRLANEYRSLVLDREAQEKQEKLNATG